MEFHFYFIEKGAGNETEVHTDTRVADLDPFHRSVRNRTAVWLKSFPSFPPSSPYFQLFLIQEKQKSINDRRALQQMAILKTRQRSHSGENSSLGTAWQHKTWRPAIEKSYKHKLSRRDRSYWSTEEPWRWTTHPNGWLSRLSQPWFHPNLELCQTYEDTGWRIGTQVSFMLATTLWNKVTGHSLGSPLDERDDPVFISASSSGL